MGYLSTDLTDGENDGFKAAAPSFISIGVDGFNLSELKVEGVDADQSESYVQIQMLNESGVPTQYFDWWHGGKGKYKNDGWYEDSTRIDGEDEEVTFSKGQGLYFNSVAGAKIVSAGEVLAENVVVDLVEGFCMTANPYPCTIGLSTIEILDVDADSSESYVQIQMLNESGVPYQYFDWWHGGKGKYKNDGWYEDSTRIDGEEEEFDVFPGQSLYIQAVDGAKIKFNCPEFLAPAAE